MATIVNDLVSFLQCGEAISANDAIYIDSSDGKIYKFDATDDTQTFAGIAKESGVLDDFVKVVQSGRIKGFTGLTAGAFVYASTTTPGGFQLIEPAASQKIILGIAKSDTELVINGGLGIKPGGDGAGGGGLDTYYTETMDGFSDVSDFATGNNAAFLGGGTLQGTLALDDSTPLSGDKSLTYTQAAGSLNDYFASELIDLDLKQRANWTGMNFYFTYDGDDNDGKFVVYDVTNGAEINATLSLVKTQSGATRYTLTAYVPDTCTQIRWGYQVLVENVGAELKLDDVELSSDPFVYKDLIDPPVAARYTSNNGQSVSNSEATLVFEDIDQDTHSAYNTSTGEYTTPISGWYDVNFEIGIDGNYATNEAVYLYLNVNSIRRKRSNVTGSGANNGVFASLNDQIYLEKGDVVEARVFSSISENLISTTSDNVFSITRIPEATEHVVTPATSTLSDWTEFTPTLDNQGPTSSISGYYRRVGDSVQVQVAATYSGSGSASNLAFNLSTNLNLNIDTNKITDQGFADNVGSGIWYDDSGGQGGFIGPDFRGSNQITFIRSNSNTLLGSDFANNDRMSFNITVPIAEWSSNATFLAAVPTPLTAYIKDVKLSGTAGGTFTAGAWQTRDLNTLEGDTQFVSLSSSQFTLQPGKYEIEASAPAYRVDGHKVKLYNITDSTDSILGSSERSNTDGGSDTQTISTMMGSLTLTSSKTFEVQHRCESTLTGGGFGTNTTYGVDEVYTQVKITKIG